MTAFPDKNLVGPLKIDLQSPRPAAPARRRLQRLRVDVAVGYSHRPGHPVTGLADDLDIKLVCSVFDERIDRRHDFGNVYGRARGVADADLAVEVPKVSTFGQDFGAFSFDVLANIVLAGVQQAVAVFAVDIERVGFFQTVLK